MNDLLDPVLVLRHPRVDAGELVPRAADAPRGDADLAALLVVAVPVLALEQRAAAVALFGGQKHLFPIVVCILIFAFANHITRLGPPTLIFGFSGKPRVTHAAGVLVFAAEVLVSAVGAQHGGEDAAGRPQAVAGLANGVWPHADIYEAERVARPAAVPQSAPAGDYRVLALEAVVAVLVDADRLKGVRVRRARSWRLPIQGC